MKRITITTTNNTGATDTSLWTAGTAKDNRRVAQIRSGSDDDARALYTLVLSEDGTLEVFDHAECANVTLGKTK